MELYHVPSGTIYEFTGRGYVQFLKSMDVSGKKRIRSNDPTMDVVRQRKM